MAEKKYALSWPLAICLLIAGGLITVAAQTAIASYNDRLNSEQQTALDAYKRVVDICYSQRASACGDLGAIEECKEMARKRLEVRGLSEDRFLTDFVGTFSRENEIYRCAAYEAHDIR